MRASWIRLNGICDNYTDEHKTAHITSNPKEASQRLPSRGHANITSARRFSGWAEGEPLGRGDPEPAAERSARITAPPGSAGSPGLSKRLNPIQWHLEVRV